MDRKNLILAILGRKESGKSYIAQKLASALIAAGRRVVIVDPTDSFSSPTFSIRRDVLNHLANLSDRSVVVKPENDLDAREVFQWAYERGDLCLIVDEIDMWFDPYSPDPDLMSIVRYGRHRRISLIGIVQRPASVNKNLLAQADIKIFFCVSEPNDLAYIARWTGFDVERIRSLPARKYIVQKMT